MGYDGSRTPTLIASLKEDPGEEFTASGREERTGVPRKYVRRALTTDAERQARTPMPGVTMVNKRGLWHYSWTGRA